ncbi:hypothetical protein JHK87_031050 [Glycine soja]|nr:hypothetical protein JHK87_031050 [Glycine soja]
MANSSSSLLTLANNNTSNLSLQLPPITIKLDRDNYSLWRSTIISALETFELESFILSPTPPRKTHITTTSDDRLVLLWIKSTLSDRAFSIVVCASSSHMAWTAIDKTFQAQTRARRMALKPQLQTLNKGSLSMIEYIEGKRSIADSLTENLHPISDEDLVGYLLSGLDSSYGPFSTAFMMKDAYASVDDLVGLLLEYKRVSFLYEQKFYSMDPSVRGLGTSRKRD